MQPRRVPLSSDIAKLSNLRKNSSGLIRGEAQALNFMRKNYPFSFVHLQTRYTRETIEWQDKEENRKQINNNSNNN